MTRILAAVILLCVSGWSQILSPIEFGSSASFPALALGAHASTDNGASSATTVVVNLTPQQAGSTIVCGVHYADASTFTSVTDNKNAGSYLPGASLMRENNHTYDQGIYYHENVAASATTITLTYATTNAQGKMACLEIKNTPTSYGFDSTFIAGAAGSGSNPTSGSTLTPSNNGEFVYAAASSDFGSMTAGTNYTLLDAMTGTTAAQFIPEYWLQVSKTATNAPFTGGGADYADQMGAWAPQQSGTCGVSAVIDWSGGTNSNNPAAGDLASSTHGNVSQPNADRAAELAYGSHKPGSWLTAASGIIYNTAAYAPFQTTRNCPVYSGSGTTAATLGLDQPTGIGAGLTWTFDTSATTVTAWMCAETTTPVAHAGTIDVFSIARDDNSDYVNLQWNSNGSAGTWLLEGKGGSSSASAFNWAANTWYGFRLTYLAGSGSDSIAVYSFTSAQCQGTANLLGTLTATSAAIGPPNELRILGNLANTYATGTDFYMGAILVDYLYGAALNP